MNECQIWGPNGLVCVRPFERRPCPECHASAASVHGESPAAPAAPSGRPETSSGSQDAVRQCPSRIRNDWTRGRTRACILPADHAEPHENGPHMWGDHAPGAHLQMDPQDDLRRLADRYRAERDAARAEAATQREAAARGYAGWEKCQAEVIEVTAERDRLANQIAEVERLRALETAARAWLRRYAEDLTAAGRRTTELAAAVDALDQEGKADA